MRNGIISPLPGKIKPSQRSRRMIGDFICKVVFTRSEVPNWSMHRAGITERKILSYLHVLNDLRTQPSSLLNALARIVILMSGVNDIPHKCIGPRGMSNGYCCTFGFTIAMTKRWVFFQRAELKHSNCIV